VVGIIEYIAGCEIQWHGMLAIFGACYLISNELSFYAVFFCLGMGKVFFGSCIKNGTYKSTHKNYKGPGQICSPISVNKGPLQAPVIPQPSPKSRPPIRFAFHSKAWVLAKYSSFSLRVEVLKKQ